MGVSYAPSENPRTVVVDSDAPRRLPRPRMIPGNLEGLRVLELAGRLLGDLGADVVQIEPPGGHALRRRGPFWRGIVDRERSLPWLAQNTSKRGITLDLETGRGGELFLDLCVRADAVIETRMPGALDPLGIGYGAQRARNRRIVLCSITPFGQTGPWRDRRASD